MKTVRIVVVSCAMAACGAMLSAQADNFGPEWVEDTDAGSLPGNAQNTSGTGPMGAIRGSLGGDLNPGTDSVDMFFINIFDVKRFQASTFPPGFGEFDTQLWLFRVDGKGLLANDNGTGGESGESRLLPFSNDNSGAAVTRPGVYLLAITAYNFDCVSDGGFIFNQANRFEISGPDGQGGSLPIIGWEEQGGGDGTEEVQYRMVLQGVRFANVPAPGALAALGLAGLLGRSRRRA